MKKILTLSLLAALVISTTASALTATPPTKTLTTWINNTTTGSGTLIIKTNGRTTTQSGLTSTTTLVRTGDEVTVTAKPNTGSTFSGWGGYCEGSNKDTCTIKKMVDNKNVIAKFSLKQPTLSKNDLIAASSTCAKAALVKRDTTVIAALNKYTADWIAALMARTEKQKLAYDKVGSQRVLAMNESRKSAKAAQAIIAKTMNTAKANANSLYKLELKACGVGSEGILDD